MAESVVVLEAEPAGPMPLVTPGDRASPHNDLDRLFCPNSRGQFVSCSLLFSHESLTAPTAAAAAASRNPRPMLNRLMAPITPKSAVAPQSRLRALRRSATWAETNAMTAPVAIASAHGSTSNNELFPSATMRVR